MSNLYFLNDDHTYRPCTIREWSNQYFNHKNVSKKTLACDHISDKRISTVWLGVDHNVFTNINNTAPILFETMIFTGDENLEIYLDRYSTWDEAMSGHKRAIKWVIDGCNDEEL
jgi:hypothetical protein